MGQKELEQYRAAVARERSLPHRYVPTEADQIAQEKLLRRNTTIWKLTHDLLTKPNQLSDHDCDTLRAAFINALVGKHIVDIEL